LFTQIIKLRDFLASHNSNYKGYYLL